ncbi:alpha/beta hydrolase [Dictyobacter alpinus]|uniref:Alpha/beta hydrolase n=1 Tax=Dictyobacter alpinus TaxID=2014873 RepID=A0A402BKP3_9CHLR|nr:alpha/beta hydrolase [Dictyobacter alpinus]GCE31899.1 alpha/beta hydrolase [Dictyobacter alpinus]
MESKKHDINVTLSNIQNCLQAIREQPLDSLTVEHYRASFDALSTLYTMQSAVTIEAFTLEGLPAEWIIPANAIPEQTILYFHSGTYINGSLCTDRALVSALASMTQTRILQIAYRLAPEHPFPAAITDGLIAYQWLLAQHHSPRHMAIMGTGAGGGIALSVLLLARDQHYPFPIMVACLSPWLDLTTAGLNVKKQVTTDSVLSIGLLTYAAQLYVSPEEASQPLASPLYADLHGLPPLFLQVTQHELLHDDAYTLVKHATASGAKARCVTWPDVFHGWHAFADRLPEGQAALDQIAAYYSKHVALANGNWPDKTADNPYS